MDRDDDLHCGLTQEFDEFDMDRDQITPNITTTNDPTPDDRNPERDYNTAFKGHTGFYVHETGRLQHAEVQSADGYTLTVITQYGDDDDRQSKVLRVDDYRYKNQWIHDIEEGINVEREQLRAACAAIGNSQLTIPKCQSSDAMNRKLL